MNQHLWIYLTEREEEGAAGDWKRKGGPAAREEAETESRVSRGKRVCDLCGFLVIFYYLKLTSRFRNSLSTPTIMKLTKYLNTTTILTNQD